MLRIRQIIGLNGSTVITISLLQPASILPDSRSHFHELSRAAGPQ